ncbi:hypothetical protein Ddye_023845 [Dipteronia dyeriana]|uniref:Uncharacterized protein n=1 Tax=Dipteronia dyeriana TaxID=168575 RepID=A0AAD9TTR3_9ROSI|nr:hypothetical protein Ddye_023845 [Dipteronia dyeriana]
MANNGTQGKSKAVWDPRAHEIWVDLAIEQVRPRNRNGTHLSKQGETVSRQFGIVFKKMVMLAFDEIWSLEEYNEVPDYIRNNDKYWPYFKDGKELNMTHVYIFKAIRNTELKFPKPPDGNVIDRCFCVWKARWRILQYMPNYNFDKQVAIVTASLALYNFIRRDAIANVELESCDENQDYVSEPEDEESYINLTIDENHIGVVRDRIVRELMLS